MKLGGLNIKNVAIMATSGGAGKDTVANYIVDNLMNGRACKRALGKPIHELAEQFTNHNVERHHLQDLGESIRKIFGVDAWIKYLDRETEDLKVPLIIPDIRKLIEFAYYCIEKGFAPLYIYVNPEVAKQRLIKRDGGFCEEDLKRNIEYQMNFVEQFPMDTVEDNGLRKLNAPYPFNNIYVVNNSGDFEQTKKQLDSWFERINNGNNTCDKRSVGI